LMKNGLLRWAAAFLAALIVVGAVGATAAYADDSTPPATGTAVPRGDGPGPGRERGLPQAELEAAAEVLDMTTSDLSAALKEGKTLEDLAASAGVDIQDVQDAIKAARDTEMRARIEQAVSDGAMTQDKADWLLEGLEKGFLDGPGFGFGGHGHGGPPPADAPAPATAAP
jgi:uncharacterized membrane protein